MSLPKIAEFGHTFGRPWICIRETEFGAQSAILLRNLLQDRGIAIRPNAT